jgi:hypothetical protein
MKEPKSGYCLLRITSQEYANDLIENGTVYCNTLNLFKEIEDGNVRGDKDEGITRILNLTKNKIQRFEINLINKTLPPINLHPEAFNLKERENEIYYNVYCMYAINLDNVIANKQLYVNERIKEFGTHCVIFQNSAEFFNRLVSELQRQGLKFQANMVSYYNPKTYNGKLSYFHKPDTYAYQSEFRILISSRENKPIIIKLGSLEDIAAVAEYSTIFDSENPPIYFL